MEENLIEKTGKSLSQWKSELAEKQFDKHGEIMSYLKQHCGVSHGYANFIALKFRESDAASYTNDELIAAQYTRKEGLLPTFEILRKVIMSFGDDVEEVPKKAAVSYRRKRQFALVKPATKTRMDIGLKFTDRAVEGRLLDSGPFGTMCTHRIILNVGDDVDDALVTYLRAAYLEAG